MFFTDMTFIGVHPTAGHKPVTYAALDNELRMLALGKGSPEEVLAFLAGQSRTLVAICSPRRPNIGLMQDDNVRNSLHPTPAPGRWRDFRVAEYQLRQHGIRMPGTNVNASDCPNWMQLGFSLFRQLEKMGYTEFLRSDSDRQVMEVYPHACYTVLLERIPLAKDTLEGRIQRQLILYERKVRVSDPMLVFEEITRFKLLHGILPLEDLLVTDELDALVAAYTAWLALTQPQAVTTLGNVDEGEIVLPVADLHTNYSG